jgi:hypothetical protein
LYRSLLDVVEKLRAHDMLVLRTIQYSTTTRRYHYRSLPTIIAIILKMTKRAFAGVTTSEKTRKGPERRNYDDDSVADRLASHRDFFGQSQELDLMSYQICEQQMTYPSTKQSKTSRLATKGDCACNDSPRNTSQRHDSDRAEDPIRHGFRKDWNRQPMFRVYIPRSRCLCVSAYFILDTVLPSTAHSPLHLLELIALPPYSDRLLY